MEIIVGKNAGFCYGVDNAVTKTYEYVKNNKGKKVYCLGELVHNKQVTNMLKQDGVIFINELSELGQVNGTNKDITVIIRAHGEPKLTYDKLKRDNIEILDLTCPNVLAIHKVVEEHILKGDYIFLIGKKTHPEVIGTYGFCQMNCSIIEEKTDIDLAFSEVLDKNINKIFVVSQTTFSLEKFEEYVEIIEKKVNKINEDFLNNGRSETFLQNMEKGINIKTIRLEVRNTICNATKIRQEETEQLSKEVDYMIIIGGKNSSNTRKLYDIAKKNCDNTVIIETYRELKEEGLNRTNSMQENNKEEDVNKKILEKIKHSNVVGIMAGASTPKESIEEVIEFLKVVC